MLKEGRRIKGKRVFSEDIKLKNIRSWGLLTKGGHMGPPLRGIHGNQSIK